MINNKHFIYLDILKIIAMLMVIFNHTGRSGFVLFTIARGKLLSPLYLVSGIFCRIAVPLFFMVSGATLISKTEDTHSFFHRIKKYMIILLVASIMMYNYRVFRSNDFEKFNINDFFQILYSKQIITPYWFLYYYISYLLMLPLIRKLASILKEKDYLYILFLMFIINIFPLLGWFFWKSDIHHNPNIVFFIEQRYFFYPLFGYYIHHNLNDYDKLKRYFFIGMILSVCSICLVAILTTWRCTVLNCWSNENAAQYFFTSLIFIPTITTFIGIKKYTITPPPLD